MLQNYEVTFTVFKPNNGGPMCSDSSVTNKKTVVQAAGSELARRLVEAQFGPLCKTYGARPC